MPKISGITIAVIFFYADHNGVYLDNYGTATTFTWSLTDPSNRSIVWIWNLSPAAVTVTWENIYYKNDAIHYTEFYTREGQNEAAEGGRIPK